MTGCERFGFELSAWLDGELGPPVRADLEAHLPGCAACRSALESLRRLDGAIQALPRPEVSPRFEARFWARLARDGERRGLRSRLVAWLRPVPGPGLRAVQLAVAAAVLAALAVLATPRQQAPIPDEDWAIVTDAEQFELLVSDDLDLIEALEVLEAWDASEGT